MSEINDCAVYLPHFPTADVAVWFGSFLGNHVLLSSAPLCNTLQKCFLTITPGQPMSYELILQHHTIEHCYTPLATMRFQFCLDCAFFFQFKTKLFN